MSEAGGVAMFWTNIAVKPVEKALAPRGGDRPGGDRPRRARTALDRDGRYRGAHMRIYVQFSRVGEAFTGEAVGESNLPQADLVPHPIDDARQAAGNPGLGTPTPPGDRFRKPDLDVAVLGMDRRCSWGRNSRRFAPSRSLRAVPLGRSPSSTGRGG